jgi:hypothetical protein
MRPLESKMPLISFQVLGLVKSPERYTENKASFRESEIHFLTKNMTQNVEN